MNARTDYQCSDPHWRRTLSGVEQQRYEARMNELRRELAAQGIPMLRPVTAAQYRREHRAIPRSARVILWILVALPLCWALTAGALLA